MRAIRLPEGFRLRWKADPLFRVGVLLSALLLLLAILAPLLAPHDPLQGDLSRDYLARPGRQFFLGADAQGRDVLSRVIYGVRISLLVGLGSQSIALILGVSLGLISGYARGWVDLLIMRVADITLAFPSLLLLIAVAAIVPPSIGVTLMIIGVVGWAALARLVRGQVLLLRNSDYVTASRALGASHFWIIRKHLLPNVLPPVIVAITLGIGGAIMAEAALSFLGLGVRPPTPSLGGMVAEGRDLLRVAPWVSVVPGLVIGLAVLGFNLLGDGLRESLDPRK